MQIFNCKKKQIFFIALSGVLIPFATSIAAAAILKRSKISNDDGNHQQAYLSSHPLISKKT
jgi:hypothetical protein